MFPFLRLDSLTKRFERNGGYILALERLSLSIDAGSWVVIVGSNGSGKSTLLRAVQGEIELDEGSISKNGQDITGIASHLRARWIGKVNQDPGEGTAPTLTVAENLSLAEKRSRFPGLRRLVAASGDKRRFREILEPFDLGLENRLDDQVGGLSGGLRQALALAMASVGPIECLLLDEHIASLDPRISGRVMTMTEELVRSRSLTCLMVIHDLDRALRWGDRIVVLHRGSVVLDAPQGRGGLSRTELVKLFY